MDKNLETLGAVHTHTHGVTSERRKKLTARVKSIIALALILPLLHLSHPVQAREELPDNLIEEKDAKINEIMLGAGSEFTLNVAYDKVSKSAKLTWSAVANASDYIIYQQKNGGEQLVIDATKATTTTIPNIKDTTAPNAPQVTATLTADEFGNNLTIKPSTDKGTEYKHYVEAKIGKSGTAIGYIVFMVDYGSKNSKMIDKQHANDISVKDILVQMGGELIAQGIQIGLVVNGGDKATKSWNFTSNIETFKNNVYSMYKITHGAMYNGMAVAREMLNRTGSENKAILMFQDSDDKFRESAIKPLLQENITNYLIGCLSSGWGNRYKPYGPVTYAVTKAQLYGCFEEMFGRIEADFKTKSNTATTTVTSGIKGYKYAITTSSTHTFTKNDPIVQLKDIPTYVSGENLPNQYLHIVAVDNEENESPVSTVLLKVPTKIRLRTTYEKGMNYVPLKWTINNPTPGYTYSLYRQELEEDPTTKKLVVKNESLIETITDTTRTLSYTVPGTYYWTVPDDVTELKVAVVGGGGRRFISIGYCTCDRCNR